MTDEEIIATLLLLSRKHIKIKEQEAIRLACNKLLQIMDLPLEFVEKDHDRERINPEA